MLLPLERALTPSSNGNVVMISLKSNFWGMRTPLTVYRPVGSPSETLFSINFMARLYIKNLKPYSLVAYSFNNNFQSISFEPDEVKDCSGLELTTEANFQAFVKTYVLTNTLSLIIIN
jgi:hypothetical protein